MRVVRARRKAPFSTCSVHVSPLQDNLGLESECDWGVSQMKKAELVLPAVSSPSKAQSPAHHKSFRKTVELKSKGKQLAGWLRGRNIQVLVVFEPNLKLIPAFLVQL